ncbi:MAG: MotA/TolQ/ExbB proton channel family protein [gamma proteobacterium symbiont of Bathyaustriella thionipta]|nr:MotA/TolQ/ExbB proton channel family protein [gamma proteobacterium symbiont of Bathyaustriella thionipta]
MFHTALLQLSSFFERGGPLMWLLALLSLLIWSGLLEQLFFLREITPKLSGEARNLAQQPAGLQLEALRRRLLSRARNRLQRLLPVLRTLVLLCPLLGLTGTVLGMIEVFDSIAILGTAEPRAMSSGISAAVLSTMAGLMVALPGLYLVNLVEHRIQRILHRLRLESTPVTEAA